MNNNWILKYTDDIFGYCIKRLNNIDNAKDLTQEILLESIKGYNNSIKNEKAWVWKIAHNRYAKYINANKIVFMSFEDSGIENLLPSQDDFTLNASTDKKAIFNAVHSLHKSHRDILIDYYVSELAYAEIAKKRDLPINTVKTRLYYGKEKLKERWQYKMDNGNIYEKINWFLCCNGCCNTGYLERQISKAITLACYETALTIEEISLKTGIPCMYIEDELDNLLYGEIIIKNHVKYITNIIIHSKKLAKDIEELQLINSSSIKEKTNNILKSYENEIKSIGFYGNDWDSSKTWWFIIPILLRQACEDARQQNGNVKSVPFPPRKDGGNGWIFVNETNDKNHENFSGRNGYYGENQMIRYYWTSKYFNNELNNYLQSLKNTDINNLDEYQRAQGVKYGVLNSDGTSKIAIFTNEQFEKLDKLNRTMAGELVSLILPLIDKLYALIKNEVPKHLHDQINGSFGAELNTIIAIVLEQLESDNKLQNDTIEYFTSQILIIKN